MNRIHYALASDVGAGVMVMGTKVLFGQSIRGATMTRKTAVPGIVVAMALVFAAVPTVAGATSAPVRAASSAPGVTSTEITTGAISTLTGPLAADFNGVVPGIKAYFDMINAQGGVNGRKLNL